MSSSWAFPCRNYFKTSYECKILNKITNASLKRNLMAMFHWTNSHSIRMSVYMCKKEEVSKEGEEYVMMIMYKVVQIWPGQTVTCLHTISPGNIWTTSYIFHATDKGKISL
jgi:hypothetical protein